MLPASFRSARGFFPGAGAGRFSRILRGGEFAAFFRSPPRLVHLAATADTQAIGGNVFGNRGPGSDVGVIADAHGRYENRVATNEHSLADRRGMLLKAIIVARDRSSANIGLGADLRIAEIGKVRHFRAFADDGLFRLHEVANPSAAFDLRARAQARERADGRAIFQATLDNQRMRFDFHVVADIGIHDDASGLYAAADAAFRFAKQLHAGFDHRVFPGGHFRVDKHSLRQLNRHARVHERAAFPFAEDAV